MTQLDRIRALPVLCEAEPEALRRVAAVAVWRSFAPGELILTAEDPSRDVWFVQEGMVRIEMRTSAGHELLLTELGAGEMFGEVAAIDEAPRSAGATALVRSSLCAVPAGEFLDAARSTPAACLALLRRVTAILRRQSHRILEREALPVRLRLCAELLRLSRPRLGDGTGQERIVSPPPPHQDLGARIGARREVVSRELGQLAAEGLLVRSRGGLVLPHPTALREAVDRELEGEMER